MKLLFVSSFCVFISSERLIMTVLIWLGCDSRYKSVSPAQHVFSCFVLTHLPHILKKIYCFCIVIDSYDAVLHSKENLTRLLYLYASSEVFHQLECTLNNNSTKKTICFLFFLFFLCMFFIATKFWSQNLRVP